MTVADACRASGFDPGNAIILLIEHRPIDRSFSEAGSVTTAFGL
jgi:hypothetical protein